jgi:hypothetical protein
MPANITQQQRMIYQGICAACPWRSYGQPYEPTLTQALAHAAAFTHQVDIAVFGTVTLTPTPRANGRPGSTDPPTSKARER